MPMKRKTAWLLIGILACLWVGSIWLYQRQQLAHPVFFRHHYDLVSNGQEYELFLHYLSNRGEQDVYSISFSGLRHPIIVNDRVIETYRYHRLHRITANIPEEMVAEGTAATRITVQFMDGREQTVDIGWIRFGKEYGNPSMDQTKAGGSNDGSRFDEYNLDERLTLLPPDTGHLALTPAELNLTMNGRPWSEVRFPVTLDKGQTLLFEHAFRFSPDDRRQHAFYDMSLLIPYQSDSGQSGAVRIRLEYRPRLDEEAIQAYLKTEAIQR